MLNSILLKLLGIEIAYADTDPWGGSAFGTGILANMTDVLALFNTPVMWILGALTLCAILAVLIKSVIH